MRLEGVQARSGGWDLHVFPKPGEVRQHRDVSAAAASRPQLASWEVEVLGEGGHGARPHQFDRLRSGLRAGW